ncbi:hypothetical protein QYE76_020641 [Lolium multiflorum]|uniref:Uncharacterized protein n=1 Tax=Lolium multiflorum TaxID=4521 RepID=A0AAD8VQ75_LOLMU|nr:hypothetical protein QYE76_020641 [Lolium multiflorum]
MIFSSYFRCVFVQFVLDRYCRPCFSDTAVLAGTASSYSAALPPAIEPALHLHSNRLTCSTPCSPTPAPPQAPGPPPLALPRTQRLPSCRQLPPCTGSKLTEPLPAGLPLAHSHHAAPRPSSSPTTLRPAPSSTTARSTPRPRPRPPFSAPGRAAPAPPHLAPQQSPTRPRLGPWPVRRRHKLARPCSTRPSLPRPQLRSTAEPPILHAATYRTAAATISSHRSSFAHANQGLRGWPHRGDGATLDTRGEKWANLQLILQETNLEPGADSIVWNLDPTGGYSVSSMYRKLSEGASVAHARDLWTPLAKAQDKANLSELTRQLKLLHAELVANDHFCRANMDSEEEDMEDYMDYFEEDTSASTADVEEHVELDTNYGSTSTADVEEHVELDTNYGSTSIADMADIEELYIDNGSTSMDYMVEHHHEDDIDSTMNNTDGATKRVLMHMIIYIKLFIWIIKSVTNMIIIDTPLQAQQGAKNIIPRHVSHLLHMTRTVIDSHYLMIVVDHYHLMVSIDIRPHMTFADTSHLMIAIDHHLPRIFDDTHQDMVMRHEDESLDMKATNTIIGCLPLQGWRGHIKRTSLVRRLLPLVPPPQCPLPRHMPMDSDATSASNKAILHRNVPISYVRCERPRVTWHGNAHRQAPRCSTPTSYMSKPPRSLWRPHFKMKIDKANSRVKLIRA